MEVKEEHEDFTDKMLELGLKLKAVEGRLEALRSKHEKELATFAHNLKNPIGIVNSFSEMLQENTTMDSEKKSKYLHIIQSSSKFSLDLVNSFQEYNKLSNDSFEFQLEEVSLDVFIDTLISEQTEILKRRNQSIYFKNNCNSEVNLRLDKALFRNAFFNIVQNASRFSAANTNVQIVVEELEEGIAISAVDEGIGISAEDLPNLTNAFFTVNTYDVHQEKCIGLGLAKTAIALNKMGGTLNFSSAPESGTQAQIVLKK